MSFSGDWTIFIAMFDNTRIKAKPYHDQNNEIIIASDGTHADILIPVKNHIYDWSSFLGHKNDNAASYLSIGWGDYRHRFIFKPSLWHHIPARWGETAFLNVKFLSVKELEKKTKVVRLKISRKQYIQLVNNIQKNFVDVTPIDSGKNDFLFKAYGGYYFIENNSNNWVNNHLLSIGLDGFRQVILPQTILNFHNRQVQLMCGASDVLITQ